MKTKKYLFVLFAIISITAFAQKIDTNYYPQKKVSVSAKDYNKGVRDLAYAYAEIEENAYRNLDYIDYWRVATAYIYMGVNKDTVYNLLLKSKRDNKQGFCIILNMQLKEGGINIKKNKFYKFLGENYLDKLSDCSGVNIKPINSKSKSVFKLKRHKDYYEWDDKKTKDSIIYFDRKPKSNQRYYSQYRSNIKSFWYKLEHKDSTKSLKQKNKNSYFPSQQKGLKPIWKKQNQSNTNN